MLHHWNDVHNYQTILYYFNCSTHMASNNLCNLLFSLICVFLVFLSTWTSTSLLGVFPTKVSSRAYIHFHLSALKENETQDFTWWHMKRTSKSIFCSNGHIWRPPNNRVLLICECKYCLLQNVNSVYSKSPFCLKVLIPPAKRWRNCAQCREHYVHTGIWHTHICSSIAFDFAA